MKSTALGAENKKEQTINFISEAHEKFYYEKLQEVRYQDVYHKALCYCLGINGDTRKNADRIYNFKTGSVKTIFLAGNTDPLSGICSVQSKVTCHAWRDRLMLKVRLMGTKNDIAWFQKILQRHPKIEVMELSELYSNKGTSKYYRAYAEIEKSNVNKK